MVSKNIKVTLASSINNTSVLASVKTISLIMPLRGIFVRERQNKLLFTKAFSEILMKDLKKHDWAVQFVTKYQS